MAKEITASVSLRATKGSLDLVRQSAQQFDQAGTHFSYEITSVATTAAGVALTISADVATKGWAYFRNLDSTNYVEIGVQVAGTFYPLVKLLPTEFAVLPLAASAVYARAHTAATDLEFWVVER